MDETSDDAFLGGKLMLRQPRRGHRAGHDAMLLAASVDARPGDTVIDLGAGVGAAGLAVAKRVGDLALVLAEIDPALAELARFNAAANAIPAHAVVCDLTVASSCEAAGLASASADHVLMNPPFHDGGRHRASPDAARRLAHVSSSATLAQWIGVAHRLLKARGVLTMIWRADGLAEVLAEIGNKFGSLELQPVHGTRQKAAVRILLRAVKGGKAPLAVHRAAVLDGGDVEVEAAMRGETTLALVREARTAL